MCRARANKAGLVFALLLTGVAGVSHGADWTGPTQAEMALLPPYCEAKMNSGSPNRQYWYRSLGSIFQSIHHYCAGLNFLNRYYRASGRDRDSMLKFALDNFNYMLKEPDRGSPLVPEIYVQRGLALKLARRDGEALGDFNRALELNPRYGKAYLELINYYTDKGERARALEVATRSLRYLPDADILKKRYDELGGTQPYPEPVAEQEEADPAAEPATESAEAEESGAAMAAVEGEEGMSDTEPAGESAVTVPPDAFPREDRKNPWCRFCTE